MNLVSTFLNCLSTLAFPSLQLWLQRWSEGYRLSLLAHCWGHLVQDSLRNHWSTLYAVWSQGSINSWLKFSQIQSNWALNEEGTRGGGRQDTMLYPLCTQEWGYFILLFLPWNKWRRGSWFRLWYWYQQEKSDNVVSCLVCLIHGCCKIVLTVIARWKKGCSGLAAVWWPHCSFI